MCQAILLVGAKPRCEALDIGGEMWLAGGHPILCTPGMDSQGEDRCQFSGGGPGRRGDRPGRELCLRLEAGIERRARQMCDRVDEGFRSHGEGDGYSRAAVITGIRQQPDVGV